MENAAGSRLLGKPGDPAVAVLMGSNAPPREAGGLRGQRAWGGHGDVSGGEPYPPLPDRHPTWQQQGARGAETQHGFCISVL